MRTVSLSVLSVFVLLASGFSEDAPSPGSIRGEVVTMSQNGEPAVSPHARLVLRGPVNKETESDAHGAFAIDGLPPGSYNIEANAPGLNAEVVVEVKPGSVSVVPITLSVAAVTSSVTVTATEPPPMEESAQKNTIGQKTVEGAPNQNEKIESLLPLVPGVVRGPDGRINMKGAQSTQAGWLVNSANVSDPATGGNAINLPIDVVSSVQVISNPYDPEYGKFTGAISSVETRTGNMEKFHLSVQNLLPRARVRDDHVLGIGAVTPRATVTGPLITDRLAFTQSIEYRFVRTPVESLPNLQNDQKLESFDSFTQLDLKVSDKQAATLAVAIFPQKLDYVGLNTFNTQESTPDLHQRGYQISAEDRYVTQAGALLSSRLAFERFDADLLPNSSEPYRLLVETTEGGFFNRQDRNTDRVQWQEIYQLRPRNFYGTHQLKVGIDFSHSSYDGNQLFQPVDIVGVSGATLLRIEFGPRADYSVHQDEFAWFGGDQWSVTQRLTLDLGLRFDGDTVTASAHASPRAGLTLALTSDRKTLLKAGGGLFYDRVPLNVPAFPDFPDRTILTFDPTGAVVSLTPYSNVITGKIENPRSWAWNAELDRQVTERLLLRVAYQQRNTVDDFVLSPLTISNEAFLSLANRGRDFYREFQITGRYQFRHHTLNASYVRSKATGDLNDFNQFFGNNPQPVIQANARGPLPFDAPNRFLAWGEFRAPWKFTLVPVFEVHTGFPYSVINEQRDFVGPRNNERFPRFKSFDVQVFREIRIPFAGKERKMRAGIGIYNLFNNSNPRDVQNDLDSPRFGDFFNGVPRTFRGKLIFGF